MKNPTPCVRCFRWLLTCLAVFVFPSAGVEAAVYNFQSSLDPVQAGVAGTGGGFATMTLDDVSGLVTVTSGSFSNLSGATTVAHIHGLSGPGVGSSPILTLNIPLGVTAGSIAGSGSFSPANVAGMLNGLTYINIHTSTFGGGEIRGQNLLVPEPGVPALFGLGGLILSRRVRKPH